MQTREHVGEMILRIRDLLGYTLYTLMVSLVGAGAGTRCGECGHLDGLINRIYTLLPPGVSGKIMVPDTPGRDKSGPYAICEHE